MTNKVPDGRAISTDGRFRMECGVVINIKAAPAQIWSLLTNADDLPRWNSTVKSIEGPIAKGQRLKLRVTIAPERTFKPRVTTFEPEKRMVWSDGAAPMFKGTRLFSLEPRDDGTTDFAMTEVFT